MADFSKFRSSLGGFNRSDVVNYLEAASLEHQKELRRAKEQTVRLEAEKEDLSEKLAQAQAEGDELKKQLAQLQEEDASLQQQVESLAQEAAALAEQITLAEQAALEGRDEEEVQEAEFLAEKELEAYRRAEAMERNATLRAERMSARMNALCEAFRERCQDSGDEINALCTDLTAMLARLNEALSDACVIFDETDDALDQVQQADDCYDET